MSRMDSKLKCNPDNFVTEFGHENSRVSIKWTDLNMNMRRYISLPEVSKSLIGLLAVILVAATSPCLAMNGIYRVVILRVFYSDIANGHYTDQQMAQAADEIQDYFHLLSNGNLDVQISLAEAYLSHSSSHYWDKCKDVGETRSPCPPPLMEDAAEVAASAGFSFFGIDGIVLLNPFGGGDWTNGPITINRPGVNGTFQRAYDFESFPSAAYRLFSPPGPSGVWWGPWVHEIGHQLQIADNIPLGGSWNGHPSGYMSGYDLMDSCYPCGESAYGLSGAPVMNGSKQIFPGWLPSGKVNTVDAYVKPETVVISPLSADPQSSKSFQAIKVPKFAQGFSNEYYLVQPRVRDRADHQGLGIYDEGVEILDVDEWRDPPVRPMYPCNSSSDPGYPCITDFDHDARRWNCYTNPGDGQGLAVPTHAGITPSYCWPHPLWHAGQAFIPLPYGFPEIRVDSMVEKGYVVTVTRGHGLGVPDVLIIPWQTLPMESTETVDIWIDSSINGYEDTVGPSGLRYGRRGDNTVIGGGDDPSLGHENRIYARIHNGGDGAAKNIRVKFYALDPGQPGIMPGIQPMTLVGEATGNEFPSLQSLEPSGTTTVYVTWNPEPSPAIGSLDWQWQVPSFLYNFPTSVRVAIEPVEGELVATNQEAREDFGKVEAVSPPTGKEYLAYDPFFFIKNPWPYPEKFYLDIHSTLPSGWTYNLVDLPAEITLEGGEQIFAPLQITIPSSATYAKAVPTLTKPGVRTRKNLLTVNIRALVENENIATPPESPYRKHADAMTVGSMVLEVLPVRESKLILDARPDMMRGIVATTRHSDAFTKGIVTLSFTDALGKTTNRILKTKQGKLVSDRFTAPSTGRWTIRAVRAGNLKYAGAVSDPVTIDVEEDLLTKTQGTLGTTFDIAGKGFSGRKPKIFVEFGLEGGVNRKRLRVTARSETIVNCLWSAKLPGGVYPLFVQRAPGEHIPVGTFEVKNPVIRSAMPGTGKPGTLILVSGLFFSSSKPMVYLQDEASKKLTRCRVIESQMDPVTGSSSLNFLVPNVSAKHYSLILKNSVGEVVTGFSVEQP